MAARINKPLHDDKTKARIRASQLLNRLNSFAIGEIEMSAAQVNAAKIVIGKVVPDLKSVELANRDGEELKTVTRIVREIVDPANPDA